MVPEGAERGERGAVGGIREGTMFGHDDRWTRLWRATLTRRSPFFYLDLRQEGTWKVAVRQSSPLFFLDRFRAV